MPLCLVLPLGRALKKTKQSAIYKVVSEFMLISCFCGNKAQFSESGSVFKKTKTHSGQFFLSYLD